MKLGSDEFKALQKAWYERLKREGFKDAEDDRERLVDHHNTDFASKDTTAFLAQERYYQLASQLLHSHPFRNSQDKAIWREHCQGKNVKAIMEKLDLSRYIVNKLIEELSSLIKV